jgi:hypothetical protein
MLGMLYRKSSMEARHLSVGLLNHKAWEKVQLPQRPPSFSANTRVTFVK